MSQPRADSVFSALQGAKAAHKREKATKVVGKGESSQLKSNAAAQSIQCKTCFNTFQSTSKLPLLQQHVENKHPKSSMAICFPDVPVPA
ncbi:hypothetical protein IAU60_002413 [Kwoniella sp. DSM 27419]